MSKQVKNNTNVLLIENNYSVVRNCRIYKRWYLFYTEGLIIRQQLADEFCVMLIALRV